MATYGITHSVAPGAALVEERHKLEAAALHGGGWFYWIAGLSLVNSAVIAAGGDVNFIFGLGITLVFDAVAAQMGSSAAAVALVLNTLIAGVFVVCGSLARGRKQWAFVAGMLLYALDGLLFVVPGLWLNVGAHVFALVLIYNGWAAARKLRPVTSPFARA
jgi:hypothetical protein